MKGEDAMSFVETFIRYRRKSSRLNIILMQKLWDKNKDPELMLKIIAGVPLIYF